MNRYSTGIPALDEALGGGLIPGSLTVVHGASGVGKTQLGVMFASAMAEHGVILDLNARGDDQGHFDYARRIADWELVKGDVETLKPADIWNAPCGPADYINVFAGMGTRVFRDQVDDVTWHKWNVRIQSKLQATALFFYASFIAGRRRVVVDGLEPADRAVDSAQYEFFEYLVENVFRREARLLSREALRENFFANAAKVEAHMYDHREVATMSLITSTETTLDDMLGRKLEEGDLYAVANTVILMGRVREGHRMGRAMFIAKHRGSMCSDDILPYRLGEKGLEMV